MSKENKKDNPFDLSTKAILKRHRKWHKKWYKKCCKEKNQIKYDHFKYVVRKSGKG